MTKFDSDFDPPVTRDLHPDEFMALMEAVEEDGGQHLSQKCSGGTYTLEVPDAAGKKSWQTFNTTACLNRSRFVVPYQLPDEKGAVAELSLATVCAVDDGMAYWPRFKKQVDAVWEAT